jgi:diguanylate cyclase (GGDEF)-like protein
MIKSPGKYLFFLILLAFFTVLILPAYTFFYLYPTIGSKIIGEREANAQQLARHLVRMLETNNSRELTKETTSAFFVKQIDEARNDFNLLKVKVFSPEGDIIYSTDKSEIGQKNTNPYFHEYVAKGKPYTKVVKKDEPSLEYEIISRDVVETYAPIMGANTFLGAFEIYYDITEAKKNWEIFMYDSHKILLLLTAILLTITIYTAYRSIHYLQQRNLAIHDLKTSQKELSILHDISTTTAKTIKLDGLLPLILEKIMNIDELKAQKKGVIFLTKENLLVPAVSLGIDDLFFQHHKDLTLGSCICGKVAQTGILAITKECPFEQKTEDRDQTPYTHIIVPLKSARQILGILLIYSSRDFQITSQLQRLLESIGNQIGIAISNAQLFEETKILSLHDPLTKLANRRLMEISLNQQIQTTNRYNRNFSILILDIDHFKQYNDTYGHTAGDTILIDVAKILIQQVRESDLVVRYGGEEFLIILKEVETEPACVVAERIRKSVEKECPVTISIGAACYYDSINMKEIVKQADTALYKAKEFGRNRVFCSQHDNKNECEVLQSKT